MRVLIILPSLTRSRLITMLFLSSLALRMRHGFVQCIGVILSILRSDANRAPQSTLIIPLSFTSVFFIFDFLKISYVLFTH